MATMTSKEAKKHLWGLHPELLVSSASLHLVLIYSPKPEIALKVTSRNIIESIKGSVPHIFILYWSGLGMGNGKRNQCFSQCGRRQFPFYGPGECRLPYVEKEWWQGSSQKSPNLNISLQNVTHPRFMIWLKLERKTPVPEPKVKNMRRLFPPVVWRNGVGGGSHLAAFKLGKPDLLVKKKMYIWGHYPRYWNRKM